MNIKWECYVLQVELPTIMHYNKSISKYAKMKSINMQITFI